MSHIVFATHRLASCLFNDPCSRPLIPGSPINIDMLALELWLLLWLLLMRRATLRQGEPSQARQANQGIDSQMELDISVMRPGSGSPLTTGCGTGCIQSVTGSCSGPARGGDLLSGGRGGKGINLKVSQHFSIAHAHASVISSIHDLPSCLTAV